MPKPKKQKNKKLIFRTFDEVFAKSFKSKKFRKEYKKELVKLRKGKQKREWEELRENVSKILVKWSMPTRQIAISEIVKLFEERDAEIIAWCKERNQVDSIISFITEK